jgi:hypothetical protein
MVLGTLFLVVGWFGEVVITRTSQGARPRAGAYHLAA